MSAFYFGYRSGGGGGHFLQDVNGRTVWDSSTVGVPRSWDRLMDGGLLTNGRIKDEVTGKVYRTCATNGWHAFFWWDRSGDRRPASNSGFYVHGFDLFEHAEAFAYACAAFPRVVARQAAPLVLQP